MSLATLGSITILVLFAASLLTFAFATTGAYRRSERLIEASVQGIYAIAGLASFASALIIYAFVADEGQQTAVRVTVDEKKGPWVRYDERPTVDYELQTISMRDEATSAEE